MNNTVDNDLELLSKKLYLESPDLWIEFSDKINDRIINEMVLFFAIKYNMPSILEFAINNNSLNLDMPSKNSSYSSIKEHLIAASKQYDCKDAFNLLTNNHEVSNDIGDSKTADTVENVAKNSPKFICQNCKSNVFESGYKVVSNSVYKFSVSENKLIEMSKSGSQQVVCNDCNNILTNTTLDKLENICKVQSCNTCGRDLTEVGIFDTSKLEFDNKNNKFVSKSTSYHCVNCNSILDENQKLHFNL